MAIATARQKGYSVYVYNEKGEIMFQKTGNLAGYTCSTVTVERGGRFETFDITGTLMFVR